MKKLVTLLVLLLLCLPLFSQDVILTAEEYETILTALNESEKAITNLKSELTTALTLLEEERTARKMREVELSVLETSLKGLETEQIIDRILFTFGGGIVGYAAGLTMNVSAKN